MAIKNGSSDTVAVEAGTTQPESVAAATSTANVFTTNAQQPSAASRGLTGLQSIYAPSMSVQGLSQGLANLEKLPVFNPINGDAVPGTEFSHCVMGLGRDGKNLLVVGEHEEVQYIPFGKFVAIVENMHDPDRSSVITQNFQEGDSYTRKVERPQIIARLNSQYSVLIIAIGPAGRVIKKLKDINQTFYYYIPREELTTYYLMSKFQGINGGRLENLLNMNDACRLINLPLNPLMPRPDYLLRSN